MRRLTTLGGVLAAVVAAAIAACQPLTTDAGEIVSIDLSATPFPAVVQGDSLRDSTGAAVALGARVFNAEGDEVTGEAVTFIVTDTIRNPLIVFQDGNFVVARDDTTGTANYVAQAAGLQSVRRSVTVVLRPDTVTGQVGSTAGAADDTLRFIIPDEPTTNKAPFTVAVQSFDSASASYKAVQTWFVKFRLEFRGTTVDPKDTSDVFIANTASHRPAGDTATVVGGTVTREVRYRAAGGVVPLDSVIVFADVTYKGLLVKGAPVRMVVPIKPR